MTRSVRTRTLAALHVVAIVALLESPASAQVAVTPRSFGGYGAGSDLSPGMGGGGAMMVIPYGGMTQGFMPSRMGGGSSLSFGTRSRSSMGVRRASLRLSPMTDSMGNGPSIRTRSTSAFGGMGMGTSPGRMTSGSGVMPPSFGYPFRQPPSLLPGATSAMGMGM